MRAKPVILVVDDQPQNIELVQAYLVRQGYEIVKAANGKEALEKLSDNQIDLILLDVMMPGIDGFEVTRMIRQDNNHRLLPIILVTALREKEDRVRGIEAGCDDFISKPIDWIELLARIRSLLKVKDYNDLLSNYRLVVENAREAIIITQDLKLVFVNRAFVDMIGHSEEILTSKTFTDFIHPDDCNIVIDHHLRRMKGEEISSVYPIRVINQDGTVKWAELNTAVIQWQGKPATLNFLNDITERKKAEIRIFESEEKYRMLVENSSEAIFIAQDAMLKFVNRTSLEMFGSSYEVMTSIPFTEFIYAEDREMVLESHLRRLRGETVYPVYAFRILTREGIIRWVEIHSTVITWQGKPATLNFLTDITERKLAEERNLLKSQLLAAINRVFYETMTAESEKEVSQTCLNLALDLTDSQFGFIGKINPDGLFSTVALSDPGWEACLIPETQATAMIDNMVIRGIWGQVLLEECSLIVNDPASYPERVGLPQGHPPITSFLGVPLKDQNKTIGMIAVANRQSSYTDDHKQYLEVLSGAFVESIRRKQAEEELKKSEEKYRSILENIAEGYYEVDLAGNFTFVNDSMCRTYSYLKEELLGLNYKRYFDKDNTKKMLRIFNEIYKTGKASTEYSYELIRKDGVKRYIEASASLIKDSLGQPAGFKGIVRDVTEHREMEEAVRQSEERYRTIIEQMEDGYFEVDLAGNYTFVNDAQCRNSGYTREELIGMNNRQYVDKERGKEIYQLFRKIYETGIPIKAYDLEIMRKDGTISYDEISAALIRDSKGKPIGFRGISRDVTERKKTENALEVRMKQLSALSRAAQAVAASLELNAVLQEIVYLAGEALASDYTSVVLIDEKGHFIRSAENIPGLPAVEYRTRDKGFTNWIMKSRQPVIIDEIGEDGSVISPTDLGEGVALFVNPDLVKIGVRSLAGLPMLAKGRLLGVLYLHSLRPAVFHDQLALLTAFANQVTIAIENARLYESVQNELANRLQAEKSLQEMNLELIKTYEELREKQAMVMQQEKMASIGLLAAGVAHEIKNPLAIMLQGINYLQSTVKNDSLQTDVVERLHRAVLRADLIVRGLLSYARQDSLTLASQDILPLIDECLTLTEHEFHKKNVRLIRQCTPDLPMVSVDGNQIKQVFVNLLINGIDAMPQGGTFTIDTRQIADSEGKNFLEIIFKDTGQGIPADMINKIFDPFYTTKTGGSTGLGLSISRGIIDRHGGTIHAESPNKRGANFIIKLPVA